MKLYQLLYESTKDMAEKNGFNTNKVYYHGTNKDFDEFKSTPSYRSSGFLGAPYEITSPVFFFSDDKKTAIEFAHLRAEDSGYPSVKKCYLKFKKPLNLTKKSSFIFNLLQKHGYDLKDLIPDSELTHNREIERLNDKIHNLEQEIKFIKRNKPTPSWVKWNEDRTKIIGGSSKKAPGLEYHVPDPDEFKKENEQDIKKIQNTIKKLQNVINSLEKGSFTSKMSKSTSFDVTEFFHILDDEKVVASLRSSGYDSAFIKEENGTTSIAVFDAKQILCFK